MRLMMLSWEYPPHVVGGLGQHVRELAPELAALEPVRELHLVIPNFGGRESLESLGKLYVHRVAAPTLGNGDFYAAVHGINELLLYRMQAVAQQFGLPDLVHAHDWLVGFAAQTFCATHSTALLATIHATERGRWQGYLPDPLQQSIDCAERQLAQAAHGIIVCSRAMAHEVVNFFGVPGTKVAVIPNGVRAERFVPLLEQDLSEFRRRYAEPDEALVFYIGRLVYEKGADLLVEAAPAVLAKAPRTRFVLAGAGPLRERLEQRVRDLGLHDRVTLSGFVSDADRDRLYVVADCCVFPSRYEPFGMVALESMAAGTPVVVADVGGLGTVVTHEETGLTVYPNNVESLTWGILRTLEDPEAAQQRAELALFAARNCFAWPYIAERTQRVMAEVVAAALSNAPAVLSAPR